MLRQLWLRLPEIIPIVLRTSDFGVGLAPPVQDDLVVQVGEQPLGAGLHRLPVGGVQNRFRLGEQVEDRQLLLRQVLDDGPALLLAQVPRKGDEPQVFVDVEAAGVSASAETNRGQREAIRPTGRVGPGGVTP